MTSSVGVVVRTKDRPGFLARALADIGAQTSSTWRVVVVNDGGSRSDIDGVVAAAGLPADRVTVVDTVAPGGRCAAANAGIRALDTDLVVLHDDDDLWHPEFLARTGEWLDTHPDDLAVIAPTEIVVEHLDGSTWRSGARRPFWAGMTRVSLGEMLAVNRAVPIAVVYRRSVHDEVGGYDEGLDAVEDWDLYLRMLQRGTIGFLGGPPLAYWMQRPSADGADANSMFDLAATHVRDDQVVRDRELAAWTARNGLGLPLYIGGVERRLTERLEAIETRLAELPREVGRQIDAHQPVWSRLRRWRRVAPWRREN